MKEPWASQKEFWDEIPSFRSHYFFSRQESKLDFFPKMMMIAFITIKSSLVPLIEGLCAQIYFRFEISVVCSHFLLFLFVKEKIC